MAKKNKNEYTELEISKVDTEYRSLIPYCKPIFGDMDMIRIGAIANEIEYIEKKMPRKKSEQSKRKAMIDVYLLKQKAILLLKHFINKSK